MRIEFDGHTYTPEDIDSLREDLIVYRDRAIASFPGGIEMSLVLSHAIGVLSVVKEHVDG